MQEHYNLTFAQLKRQDNPDRYTYYEYVSKNHQRGITDCSEGKVVTIVHSKMSRSHVAILDLYLSKVPAAAKQPNGKFNRQPLPFIPTGCCPWFFEGHLGQNCIQGMVKNMMQDASIDGKRFTNHSLGATGTTLLFDAGVPEALIQKRSGHSSSKVLRMYERVTPDQDLAVSGICTAYQKYSMSQLLTLNHQLKMTTFTQMLSFQRKIWPFVTRFCAKTPTTKRYQQLCV